jgi:hypothetical protein
MQLALQETKMNSSKLINRLGRSRIIAVVAGALLVMVVSVSGLAATQASITASESKASAETYALTDVHDRVNVQELFTGSYGSNADNKLTDTFDRATAIRSGAENKLTDTFDRATAIRSGADNKLSDTFDRATAIRNQQPSQSGQLLDTWDRATAVQQHSQGTDLLDAHDRATAAFDQK